MWGIRGRCLVQVSNRSLRSSSILRKIAGHRLEKVYKDVILPCLVTSAINPAPKVRAIQYGAGVHGYMNEEKDLPMGIAPAMTKTWYDAIMGGYFVIR